MVERTSGRNQVEDWAADVELVLITMRPVFLSYNFAHHAYIVVLDTLMDGLYEFALTLNPSDATKFDDELTAIKFLERRHLPRGEFIMLRRQAR